MKKIITVSIVDDEADLRNMLTSVLEDHYDVAQAGNGAALQKALSQPAPDVVLLDVKLPDADGLEMLDRLKRDFGDSQVIILTAHDSLNNAIESIKRGAFHFISKPYAPCAATWPQIVAAVSAPTPATTTAVTGSPGY